MRRLLLVAMLLAPLPASAKEITVTLTDDDQTTMFQAIDAYTKANGATVLMRAALLFQKLQNAIAAPPTPAPSGPPK